MKNQIHQFYKTNHFMQNQLQRRIDDNVLHKVLPNVSRGNSEKKIAIVAPSFLNKNGFNIFSEYCLVILIKEQVLITIYWCDHPNYLFKKEKGCDFQILY